MARRILDTSISLDGRMTGSNQTPDEPLGHGGERLHEWPSGGDETNQRLPATAIAALARAARLCRRRRRPS
jgi:hypothetical protein